MPGGMRRGLHAALALGVAASLLAAACPWQADPEAGLSSPQACEAVPGRPGAREQGIGDEDEDGEAEHFDVALLQLKASLGGARLAERGCLGRGRTLMFAMVVPLSVCVIMLSSALSASLERARMRSLSDGVFPRAGRDQAPPTLAGKDQEMSGVVLGFVLVGGFLLNLNFTIVLPSSEQIMLKAGGNTFLSGVAISAYAVGCVLGLPFATQCSRHSYRTGVLFMAAVALVGNIAYAAMGSVGGHIGIVGMIMARLACGLEGGMTVMFASAITHLSSGWATARGVGQLVIACTLGLVLGPPASSLSQHFFPGYQAEIPPAAFMVVCVVAYGALAFCLFPSQSECFDAVGLSDYRVATMGSSSEPYTDLEVKRGWAYLGVLSVAYVCRMFQRVCWEAGVLVLLVQDYGLTTKQAGLVMALPVMASLPLVLASDLLGSFGTVNATRILTLWELLGIVLMVRLTPASTQGLVLLLVGSAIFYGTNWMTIVPLAPLRARFALKGHWALNVETSSAISWAFAFLGQFYGPLVSRALLNVCLSQNLLASCFTVLWVSGFVATEVGLNTLLSREQLHLGKQTAWEWS